MRFYCEEAEAVLRDVDSTSEGLTSAEAEKRLAAYGKNKLAEGKKCARSWKITADVGSDPEFPEVSARDAAALRELKALGITV